MRFSDLACIQFVEKEAFFPVGFNTMEAIRLKQLCCEEAQTSHTESSCEEVMRQHGRKQDTLPTPSILYFSLDTCCLLFSVSAVLLPHIPAVPPLSSLFITLSVRPFVTSLCSLLLFSPLFPILLCATLIYLS